MAHQWFGDLVTMQWWDDIWLNEGFATWMANKPLAAAHADWNVDVDEAQENQTALALDSLQSTRPIHSDVTTPAQIDEAFDAIAYQKGAAVLRMLESYVGAETFKKGINAYLQAHAYGNATSEDFCEVDRRRVGQAGRAHPADLRQPAGRAAARRLARLRQQPDRGDAEAAALRHRRRAPRERPLADSDLREGAGRATATCEVMTEESQTLTIAGACAPWVFANAGAHGYYRTAYPVRAC